MPDKKLSLTAQILIAMLLGAIIGTAINFAPDSAFITTYVTDGLLDIGGLIFIDVMKMCVVPVVFVSLVTGVTSLANPKALGRVGAKAILLYILTTAIAISLGLAIASFLNIGHGMNLAAEQAAVTEAAPSFKEVVLDFFPSNPIAAMSEGNMIQIIVFALLLGTSISFAKEPGRRLRDFFADANEVVMELVMLIIKAAPYGVFCLIGRLFAKMGFGVIDDLLGYFMTVLVVLVIHVILTNSILLKIFTGLNPLRFFRKMGSAMMFAFSTSSSNVSIPVTLETVERKLGVKNSVASFIVPLGATINMDGTAIMQGVATVFIAHAYNLHIGIGGYLMVVLTATVASIGTAGVPSVGLITLIMVLRQVGLPAEGIGLIIGVDRILDMVRTAVNITGDAAISTIIGKSENALDVETFNKKLQ
ncbi:MAG: dicarboxylate/amino acid:cation symporter [Legionellales bacterium]|nr:dicarboxylate/amino acid:cation symporter [Legionellales bacterium]|tara:strand:+ start:53953 stop:55209 length:1257 start_codon:yes stop_codon:yes gene_type:complete